MKKYHIAFWHNKGYGCCLVTSNPITTPSEMEKTKKAIEEKYKLENVAIVNLIELDGEDK